MLWEEIESAMGLACFADGKRGHAIGIPKLERLTAYALQCEEVLGELKIVLLYDDKFGL